MLKNLNVKISEEDYNIIKKNSIIPYRYAENQLRKLAQKAKNKEKITSSTNISDEIVDEIIPENYDEIINNTHEYIIDTDANADTDAVNNNDIPKTLSKETDWDAVKKNIDEEYGPKLSKKEQIRKNEEEHIMLCKKYNKDTSKFVFK